MRIFFGTLLVCWLTAGTPGQPNDPITILQKVDANLTSRTRIMESNMIIYGRRGNRTITSKVYAEGNQKAFTEYLAPEREKGIKMLKLGNMLWIYSPETDRTLQLSGHLLRQSVMGSDLSYEDMMEDRRLTDVYSAKSIRKETLMGRSCVLLELSAKVNDVNYAKQKIWVDEERFVPLKQELFAKSGQLLKVITLSEVKKVGSRWFPHKMNYKDALKNGVGTDFVILKIQFDVPIPTGIFSKAVLRK
ncbi:MAG TPA: outer membrane lipoprotein-sorting protein [Bacteroidetes bacterium]|nr:outer membrane lipoprotein-sorting protein [Bacteroidota bacterium]HRR10342.1 outer membrane lipoprotein-sorting protein [Rhodothermales bacterium]